MVSEVRTQGTEVYVVTATTTASKIGNIVSVGEFGKSAGDIISTNLDSTAVERLAGLPDNGDATITINVDPASVAHQFLNAQAGTANRHWFCVCYSDGTGAPTAAAGVITAPPASARSSSKFYGAIKSYRYGQITSDGLLQATVTVGISGAITDVFKTP